MSDFYVPTHIIFFYLKMRGFTAYRSESSLNFNFNLNNARKKIYLKNNKHCALFKCIGILVFIIIISKIRP